MSAFPWDINNLLSGAARVLYADAAQALPTQPKDIFLQESPYTAATGWKDFGAAKSAFSYERQFAIAGLTIEQEQGDVLEEVTGITRAVKVSIAEIEPTNLGIIEAAPAVGDIAAVTGQSAYKQVKTGSLESLDRYRIAFVTMRPKAAGIVTEVGGAARGRFVVGLGYSCQLSSDNISMPIAKGQLASADVTFHFFPDSTQPEGEEYGDWFLEEAGAIT